MRWSVRFTCARFRFQRLLCAFPPGGVAGPSAACDSKKRSIRPSSMLGCCTQGMQSTCGTLLTGFRQLCGRVINAIGEHNCIAYLLPAICSAHYRPAYTTHPFNLPAGPTLTTAAWRHFPSWIVLALPGQLLARPECLQPKVRC